MVACFGAGGNVVGDELLDAVRCDFRGARGRLAEIVMKVTVTECVPCEVAVGVDGVGDGGESKRRGGVVSVRPAIAIGGLRQRSASPKVRSAAKLRLSMQIARCGLEPCSAEIILPGMAGRSVLILPMRHTNYS